MELGSSPLMVDLICADCGERHTPDPFLWRCHCGGALGVAESGWVVPGRLHSRPHGLWRYREALPRVDDSNIVSLGEGLTPLVENRATGVLQKLEFLYPTGSFKDRGSTVLASCLRQLGVTRVVEDSSGNAGASVAAYLSAAGIRCDIYVPANTTPAKTRQIRSYGARLVLVEGNRSDVGRAAEEAAEQTVAYYASHLWSPYFLEGTKTFAFEVWEQLGQREPDNVILPTGAGTLLLGAHLGFRELLAAGLIRRMPRLFAVQAEACSPLYHAFRHGLHEVAETGVKWSETSAEGIRIPKPPRDREILNAVRESCGAVVAVAEGEIVRSVLALARLGLFVEPTAAVAAAGAERLRQDGLIRPAEVTVLALTGTGLKGTGDDGDST